MNKPAAVLLAGLVSTTALLAVGAAPASAAVSGVKINEVESSGGVPGDWVELVNTGTTTADLGGLRFLDNDDTHTPYVLPAGTTLAPGAFFVLDEAQFGFGLGSADSARLFQADGTTPVDSYSWTAHASTTYGRCPDGTGAFTTTTAPTKGTGNLCGATTPTTPPVTTPPVSAASPWPGGQDVATADAPGLVTGNLSGLAYEGTGTASPGVLWGVQNGPSTLFRLLPNGTQYASDPANGWSAGKQLRYPDGTGDPDAEGVTLGGPTSASGIYVSTERNNSSNKVSRNSVLRFDPSASGTTLTATREWDLTADLPPSADPNLGAEAIAWVPDSFLTAKGFRDESKNRAYAPTDYPGHGAGLFFVGLEQGGGVYAYALQDNGASTRVATVLSGLPAVMDLEYDRDTHDLWAVCDDTCNGEHHVLRISPTTGQFTSVLAYQRPTGMPNLNNEGFAIGSASECVNDRKPVFWADDGDTGGYSLRRGTLQCSALVAAPAPVVPEFPSAVLPLLVGAGLAGAWVLRRRLG